MTSSEQDYRRIAKFIESRGGTVIEAYLVPGKPAWQSPKRTRVFAVRYLDQDGSEHRALCKRRILTGIYIHQDQILKPLNSAERDLTWKTGGPRPSPLAPITLDFTEFRVHFATSIAETNADFKNHLAQVVQKAASFASANITDGISRLLFHWDVVYALLTVVYTDESMTKDAHHVVKCDFTTIDERFTIKPGDWTSLAVAYDFSRQIRAMLGELVSANPLDGLPASIGIYYSDCDRGSSEPDDFVVHRLK
jgi:hypothetical protein